MASVLAWAGSGQGSATAGRFIASLLTCLALVAPAWGATDTAAADCHRIARDLQSLDVTSRTLTAEIVDLAVDGNARDLTDPLELTEPDPRDAPAPLLYLAPRLDTIVRDVFDAVAIDPDGSKPAADDGDADIDTSAEHPPLAESTAKPDEDAGSERHAPTPRFQRQMYRTDI